MNQRTKLLDIVVGRITTPPYVHILISVVSMLPYMTKGIKITVETKSVNQLTFR